MCTSSIIYTLYLPTCGGMRTCSTRFRISSTELFEAASSSWILKETDLLNERQDSHLSHASTILTGLRQLIVFARIRAQVVFPTPLGPQNKKACASWLLRMAFCKVEVIDCCPTTVSNVAGLYFLADTMKLSIILDKTCFRAAQKY